MPEVRAIFLLDNGSLQPAATLSLRRLAAALADRIGRAVSPVSLLHSSALDPAQVGGVPAEILEPAMRRRYAEGVREFVVVPLFFGPSAALTAYIPERVRALATALSGLVVRVGPPLIDARRADDRRVAAIVAAQVRETMVRRSLVRPAVVLVDHGSPQPAVGAVRDLVARQLAFELGGSAAQVVAASMERREGEAYAFNEPLLARALAGLGGDVVVAPLFFSPGRHAGPGGDIETICREAEAARPDGLRVHLAALVGEHPGLLDVLEERCRAALVAEAIGA